MDIFISHEWPQHIEEYGDTRSLIEENPFFEEQINADEFGNPKTRHLVRVNLHNIFYRVQFNAQVFNN